MRHPHGYKLGCTYPEPVAIERALGQGETFKWEEYEFQVFHTPGHADYHMAMFGEIDGARVGLVRGTLEDGRAVALSPGDLPDDPARLVPGPGGRHAAGPCSGAPC